MGKILVLEGADASGKTTLARHLVEKRGARYLHLGPYVDVWRWHLGAYLRAARLAAAGHLVVVDRHWLSECAYGATYRGGSAYPVGARCFDRLWLRAAAVYVLCVPSNPARQIEEHRARDFASKGNAYSKDRARAIDEVVSRYSALTLWSPAPGDDYLTQANWRGRQNVDVVYYDRFSEGRRLEAIAENLLQTSTERRRTQHPLGLDPATPNYAGHLASARYLLVGDTPSPRLSRPDLAFPFVDRCSCLSSSTWLNRALHRLEVSESDLLWCNARGPELGRLAEAPLARKLPAVALGRVAERALRRLNWPHVGVPHPQWARRFNHRDDYSAVLESALREIYRRIPR